MVQSARAQLDDFPEEVGQRLTHQIEDATFELAERSVAMRSGKGCRLLTKRLQSCYYPVGKGSVLVHWGSGVLPIGRRAFHSLDGHSLLDPLLYATPLPISPDKHLAQACLTVTETSRTQARKRIAIEKAPSLCYNARGEARWTLGPLRRRTHAARPRSP
jgi:hypothetical protein